MSEVNISQSDILNVSASNLANSTSLSVTSGASSASPTLQINGIESEMMEMTLNKRGQTS
jgi:hypothetical protein